MSKRTRFTVLNTDVRPNLKNQECMGLAPEITDDAANLKVFSKPQRSCLPLLALSRQWSVLLVSLHVLFDVSIVGIFVY